MGFVSLVDAPRKQRTSKPTIRFRKTVSGGSSGSITKAVPLRGTRIDIQIDESCKVIRIGKFENGVSCGKHGMFSCSIRIFELVGNNTIPLVEGPDGWWYGNY